ncbi:MAG: JAB domain-containing protein [Polyangiaceae bacterium]
MRTISNEAIPKTAIDPGALDVLPDTHVLASVLGGSEGAAMEAAAKGLERAGGVVGLARLGFGELSGLFGAEGARRVASSLVLGRRALSPPPPVTIEDASRVHAWAMSRLAHLEHEELWMLALDGRNRLRAARCVARGGGHALSIRAGDVLACALRENARGFLLVHNHPSGDPSPSDADATFTRTVAEAAAIVGVPLLDHVVVAGPRYASVPFPADGEPRVATLVAARPREASSRRRRPRA